MTKIYDLSIPMEDSPSEPQPVKVEHKTHDTSLPIIEFVLGAKQSDMVDGLGWADDAVSLSAHSGTHVDAPWHYAPISESKKARTIDEIPLDWFYHDGVVLLISGTNRRALVLVSMTCKQRSKKYLISSNRGISF